MLPRHTDRVRYLQGMIAATETSQKVWTEEELQSLPEDGFNHEVVDGELVMSPKNNFIHGRICTRLQALKFKPSSRQFFPGAPDLAVEILSPNNSRSELDKRLRDFFSSGTQ